MLFNSLNFLIGFLPITYLVFWSLKTKKQRYIWLTITGYVFYGCWNWSFCSVMAFSTAVSYLAGLGLLKWNDPHKRKLCLVIPITIDLLLLGFFKYVNFAMSGLSQVGNLFNWNLHVRHLDILLPIGISFYTFHTISYIVDSYQRKITPTRNLFEFSCYVSLFSQLVAGPIVRFRQIESDLEHIGQADQVDCWNQGCSFFVIGMIEKVLIADSIAAIINPALAPGSYASLSTVNTWLCALGYTYYVYFDFLGYSDMAVGLGRMFGIHIPQNFNSPYKAVDIADYWRRWHISLSTCLRDYLYIPMGGSRGSRFAAYRNLMITMVIGGLWHGATVTCVLWGAYHGMLLCVQKVTGRFTDAWPALLRQSITFLLIILGLVLFRSSDLGMAGVLYHKMFTWQTGDFLPALPGLVALLGVASWLSHVAPNSFEIRHDWRPVPATALATAFALSLVFIYAGLQSPFMYFQF